LPVCEVWMVQLPASTKETVVPEIVQIAVEVEAKLTGSPELAVAARLSDVPAVWPVIAGKLMVWLAW
jgi:hypothetical protein